MTVSTKITHHPIFEKGLFAKHPELFDRFFEQASGYMRKKFETSKHCLIDAEEVETWPVITGPGFCGATHPGANNILIETLYSEKKYIYNSDSLYINSHQRVFAISDPPGKTTSSRRLFKKLDRFLETDTPDNLEAFINQVSKDTRYDDAAALSLLYFPLTSKVPGAEAVVFMSGDILLFHGNRLKNEIASISGNSQFIGTSHATFESQNIRLDKGDFFIIASDGISSLLLNNPQAALDEILLDLLQSNPKQFVSTVVHHCNAYYAVPVEGSKSIPRLGGDDNVTILSLFPDQIPELDDSQSYLLGGFLPDT